MQKWEYYAAYISPDLYFSVTTTGKSFLGRETQKTEEKRMWGHVLPDGTRLPLGCFLDYMGERGWELVTSGPMMSSEHWLYFKKPKV